MFFPVPRSIDAGEPIFQGHIRIGYGLFHYQEKVPISSEISSRVRSSFTTGSHTPKVGLFTEKSPTFSVFDFFLY